MPSIKLDQFKGIIPRTAPKLLSPNAAQTAQNVELMSGRLEALLPLGAEVDTQAGNTIFKWYRNSSSEWLSMTGIEDFAVGPIRADQYDRVYFTDGGTLKMNAWKTSKITRTVGLTAPNAAHVPTLTSSAVNKWRFNPGAIANDLRLNSSIGISLPWNTPTPETNEDITPERWEFTADGKCHVWFPVPGQRINTSTGASWVSYSLTSIFLYQLKVDTAGGGTDATKPAAYGQLTNTVSFDITDGVEGTKYAELVVESMTREGMEVEWIDGSTGKSLISGRPDGTFATFTCSDHMAHLVLNLNYVDLVGSKLRQTSYYVQTYVDDLGEESPASGISAAIEFVPGTEVVLGLGSDPGGNIATRRLYRSAAGSLEDAFFYVADITAATTAYTDTKTDAELGEVIPGFENPPTTLTGIVAMSNGFLAGWSGKTLHFSEQWHPYSWLDTYQINLEYDIIGLAVVDTDLIVMTEGHPYVVTGVHPENMTVDKIALSQSCASRRSIATMKDSVFYTSPDGIVRIRHGAGQLITEDFYTRVQWQALTPSSAISAVQDKKYFAWMTGIKLIFDMDEGLAAITSHDITATAVYTDLVDDTLYVSQSGVIKGWEKGSVNKTILWKSKEYAIQRRWAPVAGRIVADSYPVTLRLYAEGALVSTVTVSSQTAFRIPILRQERVWSLDVQNDDTIDEVMISSSMKNLRT